MADDGELPSPSPEGRRILPRPSDRQLKYVGGETRVVAVRRSATFSELRKKIENVFNAEVGIKYQLASEDLDALVSVTCDEDVDHMLDEYDRHDGGCHCGAAARLRVFLFPSVAAAHDSPLYHHHHPQHHHAIALEQRYIDAVNGRPVFAFSPAESSRGQRRRLAAVAGGARRRFTASAAPPICAAVAPSRATTGIDSTAAPPQRMRSSPPWGRRRGGGAARHRSTSRAGTTRRCTRRAATAEPARPAAT
ncbi:unnamed protein product [Spirodela intermedia]|uniref:PB1 domain-containing protein n=1 Tax=Spirodela intermedia TaxID=51605 RepID=A0A7I8IQL5_SPIIN|nr:unnamed protein product [Spirodela intermedia]CAA6660171.1 unnamed protein product [Spirodela intermedia]